MTAHPRLRNDIALAAGVVAPSWPLSSTIAVNPITGFEDRPFTQALGDAAALFGTRGMLSLDELRDAHARGRVTHTHLADALDRAVPGLDAVGREVLLIDLADGAGEPEPTRVRLTVAERHDAQHGTALADRLRNELADRCARGDLPPGRIDDPVSEAAVQGLSDRLLDDMARLGVPSDRRRAYFERHLSLLPGWVSHLRWRERIGEEHVLLRYLAVAVATEADLVDRRARFDDDPDPGGQPATGLDVRADAVRTVDGRYDRDEVLGAMALLPAPSRLAVWQDAYERAVHDELLAAVALPPMTGPSATRTDAQVVCCIDVRSELLRRHLEAQGSYDTYGYAGFFGLAARVELDGGGEGSDQCPVLIDPTTSISIVPGDPTRRRLRAGADDAWEAARHHPIAPLALAEGAGWITGGLAALRTALPSRWVGRSDRAGEVGSGAPDCSAIPVAGRAEVVAALLGIGLGAAPAPLVVLCGHTSHADNNPSESGLTCGACGGHGGGVNARAVATMANDPAVRAALAEWGAPIPDDTWFVGAEHDTATDRVRILDDVPPTHVGHLAALQADLDAAGDAVTAERARRLPGGDGTTAGARQRAHDWAEPVAELGLAGNAAFVIGPRSMTAGADLGGRAFLHSYEPQTDPSGATLAGILTAPLVVAQWINAQYHFSTTDPEVFGAGSKAVHNVVGDVGVLSGPGGDLRRGLARQSVRAGRRLLHEPVRLLAVVHGSRAHIDATIEESSTLRQLVENEWTHLVAREPGAPEWWQRTRSGWSQRPGTPAAHSAPEVAA